MSRFMKLNSSERRCSMFGEVPRLQVVDADDAMPLLEKGLAEMGAEKAGPAGDDTGAHRGASIPRDPEIPAICDTNRHVRGRTVRAFASVLHEAKGRCRCRERRDVGRRDEGVARGPAPRGPRPDRHPRRGLPPHRAPVFDLRRRRRGRIPARPRDPAHQGSSDRRRQPRPLDADGDEARGAGRAPPARAPALGAAAARRRGGPRPARRDRRRRARARRAGRERRSGWREAARPSAP